MPLPGIKYRLLASLKLHTAESPITTKELVSDLCIPGSQLRELINQLRIEGNPIASGEDGYYMAKNYSEFKHTEAHFRSRIASMMKALEGALSPFKEENQISMYDEG